MEGSGAGEETGVSQVPGHTDHPHPGLQHLLRGPGSGWSRSAGGSQSHDPVRHRVQWSLVRDEGVEHPLQQPGAAAHLILRVPGSYEVRSVAGADHHPGDGS